jgi:aflatoxin B1 aldehyde reductase
LNDIREAAEKHGLTFAECALKWMIHHSQLKVKYHDAVIIFASSAKQLESNLVDLEKGPLPEDVVKALDDGRPLIKGFQGKYWKIIFLSFGQPNLSRHVTGSGKGLGAREAH